MSSMRVPSIMNNAQQMLDLQRIKQQYAQTVLQLSSGQAIVDIGDDPTGTTEIMDYQSSINLNTQYTNQANTANSQLQSASTVVSTLTTDVNRLLSLAQEALGGTSSDESMAALAPEVNSLLSTFVSLGNTQLQGKYIFAGTNTTTVPFVDDTSTSPETVNYQGNDQSIQEQLGTSVQVTTNIPGSTLFYGSGGQGSDTDLFANTIALRDALTSGSQSAVQTAYNNLQTISNQLNQSAAQLGGWENGVTTLQSGLESFTNTLNTQLSAVQSVNYPTAVTQLNQESVSEQATLSTIAQSNTKNLFDYLA